MLSRLSYIHLRIAHLSMIQMQAKIQATTVRNILYYLETAISLGKVSLSFHYYILGPSTQFTTIKSFVKDN